MVEEKTSVEARSPGDHPKSDLRYPGYVLFVLMLVYVLNFVDRNILSILAEEDRFSSLRSNLLACPSVTCYEGTTPADVVVVEPPHRPDRHVVPTHRRIQRMMTLQQLEHADLVQLIEEFDDLLQRYEHKYFNDPHRSSL